MRQYSISNGHDAEHVGFELTHYSLDTRGKKGKSCRGRSSARKARDVPSLFQDHLDTSAGIVHQHVDMTPDSNSLRDLRVDDVLRVGDVELHEIELGRVCDTAKVLDLLEDSGSCNDLVVSAEGGLD